MEQNQQTQEELSDKDLSKKLHRIMYKAEGRGKFFFLSFLPLLLPSPYFCFIPFPSAEDFVLQSHIAYGR
jgi:hypothetical protein